MQLVNKEQIAEAFGRAVDSYDEWATLQREVADCLLYNVEDNIMSGKILDAGCGTGYLSQYLKHNANYEITALDLSNEMLLKAQNNSAAHHYVQGDIEHLPLLANQFDCVVSSLAIQWCHSFEAAIVEMLRVLKPNGHLYINTLIEPTLHELKTAWRTIDDDQHVMNFLSTSIVQASLLKLQKECSIDVKVRQYDKKLYFSNILTLLKSLQGIGATALPNRKKGLMSRSQLMTLAEGFPHIENEANLSLTYSVCEIIIIKK